MPEPRRRYLSKSALQALVCGCSNELKPPGQFWLPWSLSGNARAGLLLFLSRAGLVRIT